MSDISSLLNNLYGADQSVSSLEKTAEDHLLAALRDQGQVEENPYADYSTEELEALAGGGYEKLASSNDLLEKTAAEMLGGQVMAHAMVHEMGLIKEALASGICRVCKESHLDVQGSSICSSCLSAADE